MIGRTNYSSTGFSTSFDAGQAQTRTNITFISSAKKSFATHPITANVYLNGVHVYSSWSLQPSRTSIVFDPVSGSTFTSYEWNYGVNKSLYPDAYYITKVRYTPANIVTQENESGNVNSVEINNPNGETWSFSPSCALY